MWRLWTSRGFGPTPPPSASAEAHPNHASNKELPGTSGRNDGSIAGIAPMSGQDNRREPVKLVASVIAAAAALATSSIAAVAIDISGAGATFPYPIYAKWADAYKKETGGGLNYQSIGSGGGIKQIQAKTVTFGASDMPLKPGD